MKTVRVLTLCAALLVGACHKDAGTPPPPLKSSPKPQVHVPVVRKGPSAEELTAGMVEAASQGNSELAVLLKFELAKRPVLGQPLEVNLAILPQTDASAEIRIAGGEGLNLAPGADHMDLATVEAGQVYRRSFTVTPTAEGVLLLSLTLSLKVDETVDSRAFSIPLIVGR
ncbi:MAG: hypothetical protein ABJC66_03400 [Gammaproteobacteria bacterium]